MNPVLLVLGAGAVYAGAKLLKPKELQGVAGGTPGVRVFTPVSAAITQDQKTGLPTKPPQPGAVVAGKKVASTPKQGGGVVYSPPNAVQPNQALPIVATKTGMASIGLSSVTDVQRSLNTLGIQPRLKEDGKLGPATIANIKQFQGTHGLTVDGNAGPATKAALSAALSGLAAGPKAAIGTAANAAPPNAAPPMTVKDVQHLLNVLGAVPALKEDNAIGPKTVSAIKSFQVSHGLTPDGVAGPKTKTALFLATKAP